MATELPPIDVTSIPGLADLVDEVQRTRRPRLIRRDNEDVAILAPAAPGRTHRPRRRGLTADDPLFDLVGIGHSGGPGDVSSNKHRYLAEAYRTKGRDEAPR